MNFLMMLYADEKAGAAFSHAEMAKAMDLMYAYNASLEKAGAFVSTSGLAPTTSAKTVSHPDGALRVEDGPFAETREQLGGFYIIKADSMEDAVRLAALCPAAQWGHIEVRPFAHFE
jgi:hypothetical protein